jgi:hypothetical protein
MFHGIPTLLHDPASPLFTFVRKFGEILCEVVVYRRFAFEPLKGFVSSEYGIVIGQSGPPMTLSNMRELGWLLSRDC